MKRFFDAFTLFLFIMPAAVWAQTDAGDALAFSARLGIAARFFGGFLLVMGVIYVLLLSTRRIAAWIDKRREKGDKHNL